MNDMKFKYSIGGIFSEVGISFDIKSDLIKKVWYAMEDNIPLSDKFDAKYPNYTLSFLYSSKKDTPFYVTNATISKRYKRVEFVIYMPYHELDTNDEDLKNKKFLHYLKKGIEQVLKDYDFNTDKFDNIIDDILNQ